MPRPPAPRGRASGPILRRPLTWTHCVPSRLPYHVADAAPGGVTPRVRWWATNASPLASVSTIVDRVRFLGVSRTLTWRPRGGWATVRSGFGSFFAPKRRTTRGGAGVRSGVMTAAGDAAAG